MRILFPLVLAISMCSDDKNLCYKPEYTISHLIMRCLKELKIDGVAYLSVRGDSELQYPQGVNLALPIFSSKKSGHGNICESFKITEPMFFSGLTEICCLDNISELSANLEYPAKKSYLTELYNSGNPNDNIIVKNECVKYSESNFAYIDDCLVNKL